MFEKLKQFLCSHKYQLEEIKLGYYFPSTSYHLRCIKCRKWQI